MIEEKINEEVINEEVIIDEVLKLIKHFQDAGFKKLYIKKTSNELNLSFKFIDDNVEEEVW